MPTTPKLLLPYPAAADPADVPLDMQELAVQLDDLAGANSGLATLDATGKIPAAQLPAAATSGEVAYIEDNATFGPTALATTTPGTLIKALPSATYKAVPHFLEVSWHCVRGSALGSSFFPYLAEGGVAVAGAGPVQLDYSAYAAGNGLAMFLRIPFTPTAGVHVYEVRATSTAGPIWTFLAAAGRPLIYRTVIR